MTTPTSPIHDQDDLVHFWSTLLETAPPYGRSLWLAFVASDARPHRALTQIDGLPLAPEITGVEDITRIVAAICEDPDTSGVIVCLERGGTVGASPFEESWADALTQAVGHHLAWPVMVRTAAGVTRVPLWTSAA